MPLFHRDNRREPSVISRADRAREAGQWEAAAGLYRIALDRKPRNPPIWIQYGHALKEGGHRASAETAYRNAIAYQPAEAYLQLGHVLKLQGKMVEARLAYRCALVLDASLADAARELGQLKGDNLAAGQDGATAEAREFNEAWLNSLASAVAPPWPAARLSPFSWPSSRAASASEGIQPSFVGCHNSKPCSSAQLETRKRQLDQSRRSCARGAAMGHRRRPLPAGARP